MTATKIPTASGISRLLATAGFTRATYKNGCVDRAGFVATEAGNGAGVRVEHDTFLVHQSAERRQAMLDRYARAIGEAGWSVKPVSYSGTAIHHLIVTAKPSSPLAAKEG